jgi:hypothetical protein
MVGDDNMSTGGYVCPYCGMFFPDEMELRQHVAQEHGETTPVPLIPVPTTTAEWEATWNQIKINADTLNSPEALLKKRELEYKPLADTEYTKGSVGVGAAGASLVEAKPVDELDKEWRMNVLHAADINLLTTGLQIGIGAAGLVPFTSIAYAMSQVYQIPFIRAALNYAADVQQMPFNTVTKALIQRHLLSQATPYIPETYRLALAASQGILDDTKYKKAMAESGLNEFWADIWREQNQQYPTFSTLFNMLWRGTITSDTLKGYLRRAGYKQEVIDALMPLAEVIPPLDDLIRFAVREAYGGHTAEEQYPTYEAWATKMGLSKEFAANYWYAHWDRIPLTQMYDNLWRGNWDKDKFMDMLRIKDVHEDDREAIYNVAFRPPGIRELGYGWDTNKYTLDDIIKYRRMEGLSEEDAKKAAASLIDYRLEAEREALRREWMHLYALGRLPEEDFRKNLEAVFDMNSRTDLWVERGKLEAQRIAKEGTVTEPRIITSSEALWAFKAGLRTEEWLRGALDALLWDKSRIDLAVERAKKEIEPVVKEAPPIEYRQLSVSQIQDLYKLGRLSPDGLLVELQKIGYSPEDAVRLTDLIMYVPEKEPIFKTWSRADLADMYDLAVLDEDMLFKELLDMGYDEYHAAGLCLYIKVSVNLPDIKARYSKGWIDEQTLYYEILNLWYPEATAEELSRTLLSEELRKLWTPEARATTLFQTIVAVEKPTRTAPEKDLTKAEIIKGAKSGVLSASEASDLLQDLGYDSDEAMYLLMINQVVAAGDPDSYWEMKRVTEAYKKAQGLPYKDVPDELITYEKQLKVLHDEVERLKKEEATEEVLADALLRLSGVEARYRTIVASWNSVE